MSTAPDQAREAAGSLTVKANWARFIADTPVPPELLPQEQWQQLSGTAQEDYDELRLRHHARLVTVATPLVNEISRLGRRLVLLNRDQISARRGLVVSGQAGTGKSTAITQLGKHHEIRSRRRRGTVKGSYLPVVYITVPPAATPKMLAGELARFVGLPVKNGANQIEITNSVCDVLDRLGTDLVLVDEIHNISLTTRHGADASDQLKYLAERVSATFVYAGIDVEAKGLFSGIRGRQIAGRFASIHTRAFANGTAAERQEWGALVATLEQSLRLHRLPPGKLLRHADYLHERSGGMIGSLVHLIREAAVEAILDGSETITKATLAHVRLDHAAEHQEPTHRPPQRTSARAGSRP
ncbi:ATP-binding protein [Nocardiopsis alba]|uniref:ATP-binding protein n=1 Tax=Nocardiopsis alba TaxID=53437 RepID=UPI00362E5C7F